MTLKGSAVLCNKKNHEKTSEENKMPILSADRMGGVRKDILTEKRASAFGAGALFCIFQSLCLKQYSGGGRPFFKYLKKIKHIINLYIS